MAGREIQMYEFITQILDRVNGIKSDIDQYAALEQRTLAKTVTDDKRYTNAYKGRISASNLEYTVLHLAEATKLLASAETALSSISAKPENAQYIGIAKSIQSLRDDINKIRESLFKEQFSIGMELVTALKAAEKIRTSPFSFILINKERRRATGIITNLARDIKFVQEEANNINTNYTSNKENIETKITNLRRLSANIIIYIAVMTDSLAYCNRGQKRSLQAQITLLEQIQASITEKSSTLQKHRVGRLEHDRDTPELISQPPVPKKKSLLKDEKQKDKKAKKVQFMEGTNFDEAKPKPEKKLSPPTASENPTSFFTKPTTTPSSPPTTTPTVTPIKSSEGVSGGSNPDDKQTPSTDTQPPRQTSSHT